MAVRQWWIHPTGEDVWEWEVKTNPPEATVHVIEYSAYEEMKDRAAGNMCGYCDASMHDGYDVRKERDKYKTAITEALKALAFHHKEKHDNPDLYTAVFKILSEAKGNQ